MNVGYGDSRSEGHVQLARPVLQLGSNHRLESSAGSLKSFGTNSSNKHDGFYPSKLQAGLSGTKSLQWTASNNPQPSAKKLGKDVLEQQPQKQVELGRDLLDLISKKSFNPSTIEPASDVSFSDASSFLSFGHVSTDSIAEKPEFAGHELQASTAAIEQALEQLDDEDEDDNSIMNADSIPTNVIAWDLQSNDYHLEMTASNKTALLQRPNRPTPSAVDSSMMSKGVSADFHAEKSVQLDTANSIGASAVIAQQEDALSCNMSAMEGCHDDGSYTFEDLTAVTTSDVNEISSLRRSSAMSWGSRSGLTELDVTAHSRYASVIEEGDSSDFPSEDIATDVMSTRSGMTDLDMTVHNRSSTFVVDKLEFGATTTSSSDATDSDVSSSSGSAHGSDNSSMAALQELMNIIGKESDHDISDHEDEAGEEPVQTLADVDDSVQESIDELQHLMNIMDSSDGADLSNADVGHEDLLFYEQALADTLLYENSLKPEFRGNLMEKSSAENASDRSMSLHMSTRSMSTSGLHNDSFVKHFLNMDLNMDGSDSDSEIKECGDGRGGSASGSMGYRSILSTKGEKEVEDTFSPNRPHPSLEYPPLYFMLRRFPWLFDNIKILYLLRWRMSYPLQRCLPYSRLLRKAGINLTWGELLLLLPFFVMLFCGIVYSFVIPNVAVSGKVARFGLIGALLFAQRNSVVTLLIGMPLDRSIFYHKLAGRLGGVTGILHTISFFLDPVFREKHGNDALGGSFDTTVNASGSMIMIFMIGIIASAISRVRRQMYEIFYYLHIFFAVGMVASAYFHSGALIPCLAASIWGFDVFVRSIVMARTRYPRKAELAIVSDTVIELRFPKTAGFCYNPGQYIYISVPELSFLQWHAFSISSSPKQKTVTLHIRVAGQWTSDLYQLARKTKEVSILLEGPYGNVGVDILNDRKYKRIMLISGGIGITPMQSICEQLLYEKAKERRELESLKFIWIERDPVLMQEADFIRRTSSIGSLGSMDVDEFLSTDGSLRLDDTDIEEQPNDDNVFLRRQNSAVHEQLEHFIEHDQSINIASQLLALLPSSQTTDEQLDELYGSQHLDMSQCLDDALLLEDEGLAEEAAPRSNDAATKRRPSILSIGSVVDDETSFAENSKSWMMEAQPVVKSLANVLDLQVYLTGNTPTMSGIPFAHTGRPDIKALFQEEKKAAIEGNHTKVAILVSAPVKVQELCRKACLLYSDDQVRFDFHCECMGM